MTVTYIVLKIERYNITVTILEGKIHNMYQLLYLLILRVTNARMGVVVNPRKKKKNYFMGFAKVGPVYNIDKKIKKIFGYLNN